MDSFPLLTKMRSSSIWCGRGRSLAGSIQRLFGSLSSASEIVDVTPLAERMRGEVRRYTASNVVKMVGILADSGPLRADAELYSEKIQETFEEDNILYEVHRCPRSTPDEVEVAIQAMNARNDVHGILVFYPIFKSRIPDDRIRYLNKSTGVHYKTYDDYLRDVVSPLKDVEGLSQVHSNTRHLFRARGRDRIGDDPYIPCTALAVSKIIEEFHATENGKGRKWEGETVTVINRSEIFGRPLAGLLSLEGASVFSVDENSVLMFQPDGRLKAYSDMEMDDCLRESSIVISGVPSPDFSLPLQDIKPGAFVIDVSEGSSNVDADSLLSKEDVKFVPKVGKVTLAALEKNLIRLHRNANRSPLRA